MLFLYIYTQRVFFYYYFAKRHIQFPFVLFSNIIHFGKLFYKNYIKPRIDDEKGFKKKEEYTSYISII